MTKNLLQNPGFEEGKESPAAWRTFSKDPRGIAYVWDEARNHSGKRSVSVQGSGQGFGMWQQAVEVEGGRVYALSGYVAFENIDPRGQCCLQLVFRRSNNDIIQMIYWPGHTGSRDFAFDFPPELKVRAPAEAARAEVNLFLRGKGKAWFDDVFFGPTPTAEISGAVKCDGKPIEGARVFIWGDPWNKKCEALTDESGRYQLTDIPVAFPRYVLLAEKNGYRTRPAGDVAVKEGTTTTVNFELEAGKDPDDLRVKFGTIEYARSVPPPRIPDGARIPADADGYPEAVRPYLKSDECIQSDHPDIVAKAKELLESLPMEDRADTAKVVWAVYEWKTKNVEHEGVFATGAHGRGLEQPFMDVTSGIWQTISGRGWAWGRSFYDWCYRPHELLKLKSGICVERAWLAAALLRALNIPARSTTGSSEFWAQTPDKRGAWVGFAGAGRAAYRETGKLGSGITGHQPFFRFSTLSRPILHEDWNAQNKGLWRERHPWGERYERSDAGYKQAVADLAQFTQTGEAPSDRPKRDRRGDTPPDSQRDLEQGRLRPEPRQDCYQIHYSDVTINLLNMGEQRTLDVRFPLISESPVHSATGNDAYWTNHPECVKRTWMEEIKNPPAEGAERWLHIEFDLSPLLD